MQRFFALNLRLFSVLAPAMIRLFVATVFFAACAAFALGCGPTASTRYPVVGLALKADSPVRCGAVAIGPHRLVTAAHCVDHLKLGETAYYVTKELWETPGMGTAQAKLAMIDPRTDIAYLQTEALLAPMDLRSARDGERVSVLSPRYDEALFGVLGQGAGYFRDTTLDVQPGWSGSPIVGEDGKVVGIAVARIAPPDFARFKKCRPHTGIVAVF